ncbi:hypothetical protein QQ045_031306 [Rhodiola kirilowii]
MPTGFALPWAHQGSGNSSQPVWRPDSKSIPHKIDKHLRRVPLMFTAPLPPLSPTNVEMRKMFEEWMAEYGRAYSNPKEKEMRFKIFKETVQSVNAHNKVEGRMYDQCVNNFADLTDEEFNNTYCGFGCGAKRGLSREG